MPVMTYLGWYFDHYDKSITVKTRAEWEQTAAVFDSIQSRQPPLDPLHIHAYPHKALPDGTQFVDVDEGFPCTALGCGDVTGIDFSVMAILASQRPTALALRLAALQVAEQGLSEIAFTCEHGTHRSVACACLLAALCYPNAYLVFHTARTIRDAKIKLRDGPP